VSVITKLTGVDVCCCPSVEDCQPYIIVTMKYTNVIVTVIALCGLCFNLYVALVSVRPTVSLALLNVLQGSRVRMRAHLIAHGTPSAPRLVLGSKKFYYAIYLVP